MSASDSQDSNTPQKVEIKIQNVIQSLPSLQQKVQAVAINGYIQERKARDQEGKKAISDIKSRCQEQKAEIMKRINEILEGDLDLNDADFEGVDHLFTAEQKDLKKQHYQADKSQKFWVKVLLNNTSMHQFIKQYDTPILCYLGRIQAFQNPPKTNLTLKFYFSQNKYFTNTTITKQFLVKDGQVYQGFGDSINWNQSESVQSGKKGEKLKSSFFALFREIKCDYYDLDNNYGSHLLELETQYDLALLLYQKIIPDSIIYYLGLRNSADVDELFQGYEAASSENSERSKRSKPRSRQARSRKSIGSDEQSD